MVATSVVFAGSLGAGAVGFAKQLAGGPVGLRTLQCPHVEEAITSTAGDAQDPFLRLNDGAFDLAASFPGEEPIVVVAAMPKPSLKCDSSVHSFVRSCAGWGSKRVTVVVDEGDIPSVASAIGDQDGISSSVKRELNAKAFDACIAYDQEMAMLMKGSVVMVVGGGGREHAIALKLAQSDQVAKVVVAPGNGGTASGHPRIENLAVNVKDKASVVAAAADMGVSLVVVGPEDPLADGLCDDMTNAGIPCFGPSAGAAMLEVSKAYSKDFMKRHGIRTARFETFTDAAAAKAHVESIDYRVVVKCSGLAAGKGVLLPTNKEETLAAIDQCMVSKEFGDAGNEVVLEEFLEGEEASLLAFCDGTISICMPAAQDHKRALDGDQGLNTGGMGAYAPAPALTPALRAEAEAFVQTTVTKMAEEGNPYKGILYAGLMLTDAGVQVLEYNCRFGDPETQVLLPLLKSDLFTVMKSCVEGALKPSDITWHSGAAATIVGASPGYPQSYPKGAKMTGLDTTDPSGESDVTVYHAGTKVVDGEVVTSGGRVIAVTGRGATLRGALRKAYSAMDSGDGSGGVGFEGMHFRRDIGWRALKAPLRIGVLGSTRGTDLQAIIDAIEAGSLDATVSLVVSNKKTAPILERASKHGIASQFISAKDKTRDEYDADVTSALNAHGVDLVLMIGYMRIVSGSFCDAWKDRCLNVHPSLLPDFAGGMDTDVHAEVIAAGRTKSGCTVHFVTEEVDSGPIVVQKECEVLPDETSDSLKSKVQALEGVAFIEAINMFKDGVIGPDAAAKGGPISYKDAGVDIDAGNELVERIKPACKSTRRPGCDADLGGFGGLFDLDACGFGGDGTILVGATDGVGTKLKVAQLANVHKYVGIDLVAMCVNDLIVQGAEPLFFLDYFATGHLTVDLTATVVEGIAEGCRQSNCGLIGGETAEMPSMYAPGEYDLGGFSVGAVKQVDLLGQAGTVHVGDVVLGVSSSGVHSNGFSLVRKVVERAGLDYNAPAPFLTMDGQQLSLGEALLTPTRIYVRLLMPLIKKKLLKGLVHITGGGLSENIPRILSDDQAVSIDIEGSGWKLPPVFKWLQEQTQLDDFELTRTFNCGIGMILIVAADKQAEVMAALEAEGEAVMTLGNIEPRGGEEAEQVVMKGKLS